MKGGRAGSGLRFPEAQHTAHPSGPEKRPESLLRFARHVPDEAPPPARPAPSPDSTPGILGPARKKLLVWFGQQRRVAASPGSGPAPGRLGPPPVARLSQPPPPLQPPFPASLWGFPSPLLPSSLQRALGPGSCFLSESGLSPYLLQIQADKAQTQQPWGPPDAPPAWLGGTRALHLPPRIQQPPFPMTLGSQTLRMLITSILQLSMFQTH